MVVGDVPVSLFRIFPGVWAYLSQMDSLFPSSFHAPSVGYAEVATPQWKTFGKLAAIKGMVRGRLFELRSTTLLLSRRASCERQRLVMHTPLLWRSRAEVWLLTLVYPSFAEYAARVCRPRGQTRTRKIFP